MIDPAAAGAAAKKITIWDALARRLGRQPTNAEAAEEIERILRTARDERAK